MTYVGGQGTLKEGNQISVMPTGHLCKVDSIFINEERWVLLLYFKKVLLETLIPSMLLTASNVEMYVLSSGC